MVTESPSGPHWGPSPLLQRRGGDGDRGPGHRAPRELREVEKKGASLEASKESLVRKGGREVLEP